jgi:hemin uptake protein HemP
MHRPPALPAVDPATASGTSPGRRVGGVQTIKSEALFRGAAELQIEHRGSLYRLRQTSLGKLILTK